MKLLKFNNILVIILFSINWNIHTINKIILPIEILSSDNYIINSNSSHERIIKSFLYKNIFTILEIGSPIQKIPLIIDTKEHIFEITSYSPNNKNAYNYIYNLSSIFNKYDFYKENSSSNFKTDGCHKSNGMFADHLYDCNSYDIINIKTDFDKKIKIENFEFNMVKNKEENITGILGLGLFDNNGNINKSFLKILKNRNIIKNYNWYFYFNSWNDTKGELIIGSSPHEDFPDIYSKDNLEYTYIPISDFSFSSMSYKIVINEICVNSINDKFDIKLFNANAELSFDINNIIAPKEFENELRKKFIKNFIINEQCFKDTINHNFYYNDLIYYYCDVNIKNILFDALPSIKFTSNDLNYTFEITKDELFKIEGDFIYINILFDHGKNYWVFGKPISLKYPFIFNQDSKKIGLYRNFNKIIYKNITSGKYISKIIKIILVFILCIILIFVGFYLGKMFYQIKRKIRANELNDNYEYINEDKDKNIKNNNDNNLSIEMNFKI